MVHKFNFHVLIFIPNLIVWARGGRHIEINAPRLEDQRCYSAK